MQHLVAQNYMYFKQYDLLKDELQAGAELGQAQP